jgi:hypothetical protein
VIDGREDRCGNRADCFLGATPGAQAIKLSLQVAACLSRGPPGTLDEGRLQPGAPLRMRVERRLPALSSFLGQRPEQEMRCAAVGNRLISVLISARITRAERSLIPGMLISRGIRGRKGSRLASTSLSISVARQFAEDANAARSGDVS